MSHALRAVCFILLIVGAAESGAPASSRISCFLHLSHCWCRPYFITDGVIFVVIHIAKGRPLPLGDGPEFLELLLAVLCASEYIWLIGRLQVQGGHANQQAFFCFDVLFAAQNIYEANRT